MGAVPRSHLQFWRKTKHEFRIVSNVQIVLTRKHKRIVSLRNKRFRYNKELIADRTKIGARAKVPRRREWWGKRGQNAGKTPAFARERFLLYARDFKAGFD